MYDDFKGIRKTEFVSGCCFATSARVFSKIGLLNEDYFMYCEDNEFCRRVSNNGFDIYVIRESQIYHKVGVSTKGYNEFQLYYIYRNRINFCYSFFKGFNKFYRVLINKLRARWKMLLFLLQNKKSFAQALAFAIKDSRDIRGCRRY